ncbi:hypothetical protein [Novosphingobium terrae]|uniref:hypothetical protein n=1 Tax=Novosphingobium terrae TaxID=2726189 RepID=UPI00197E2ADB|nr:hypothetical protein [Novosphingobium terrae]
MVSQRRKIPLWKLVGGGAVHAVVPAYLLALGVDGWRFASQTHGGLDLWLTHVPGMSGWFLGAYGALGLGATALAALADRFAATPPHIDDQAESQAAQNLRQALARGRGAFGPEGDAALDRIGALRPDLGDSATQALLRDLSAMVEAGRTAVQTEDAASLRSISAAALTRIASALEQQLRDRATQAQDKALVMATYVEARYGEDKI